MTGELKENLVILNKNIHFLHRVFILLMEIVIEDGEAKELKI